MAIYVDTPIHVLRDRLMCHMFSPDLDELHVMAERLGIQRRWFQDPEAMQVSWPHYDIDQTRRQLAVEFGAIQCDKYQTVAMAAIILDEPAKLRSIHALANPHRTFAPAAHVPEWLAEQGFPQFWTWSPGS